MFLVIAFSHFSHDLDFHRLVVLHNLVKHTNKMFFQHGVTAKSLYLSFSPCKATNLICQRLLYFSLKVGKGFNKVSIVKGRSSFFPHPPNDYPVPYPPGPHGFKTHLTVIASDSDTCSYMYCHVLCQLNDCFFGYEDQGIKGTVSSQSEQTFNRAWNQCPSLRLTQ